MNMKQTLYVTLLTLLTLAGSLFAARKEPPPNPMAGKSIPELTSVLDRSTAEAERLDAAQLLRAKMPMKSDRLQKKQTMPSYAKADAKAVKVLLSGLDDSSSAVRYECRRALGCGGETAIPGLVLAMAGKQADLRSYAADALGDMGSYLDAADVPLETAVPALQKALGDKDYRVRVSAAIALWRIGERSAPALPELIKLLDDDEWAVADAAVRAVAVADPSGLKSVPALVEVLSNRKHDLREFACNELAAMGQNARPAIPALITLLDADCNNWYAGKAAAITLMGLVSYDPRKVKQDPAADIRVEIVGAIAQSIAKQTKPFVKDDRLAALCVDRNRSCPMGAEALPALPYALKRLNDWTQVPLSPWVPRAQLIHFIGKIGSQAQQQVIAEVKRLLDDEKTDKARAAKELKALLNTLEEK